MELDVASILMYRKYCNRVSLVVILRNTKIQIFISNMLLYFHCFFNIYNFLE